MSKPVRKPPEWSRDANGLAETARDLMAEARSRAGDPDLVYKLELGAHQLIRAADWLRSALGHSDCECPTCKSLAEVFCGPGSEDQHR